jgi:hypothetical protein
MDRSSARHGCFSRMQERDGRRSRAGGRSLLVRSGRPRLAGRDARNQANSAADPTRADMPLSRECSAQFRLEHCAECLFTRSGGACTSRAARSAPGCTGSSRLEISGRRRARRRAVTDRQLSSELPGIVPRCGWRRRGCRRRRRTADPPRCRSRRLGWRSCRTALASGASGSMTRAWIVMLRPSGRPLARIESDVVVATAAYAGQQGISARRSVPVPGSLRILRLPSSAAMRSTSPPRPDPFEGSALPTPSSETSMRRRPPWRRARTFAWVAWACFATFVRASDTRK